MSTAFCGLRVHCVSSEPYYWEQAYHVHPQEYPIIIDEAGHSRIFKPVAPIGVISSARSTTAEITTNEENTAQVKFWECSPYLCKYTQESLDGTVTLLQQIANTTRSQASAFYLKIDSCENKGSINRLGSFT
jgi:hypothetical protein